MSLPFILTQFYSINFQNFVEVEKFFKLYNFGVLPKGFTFSTIRDVTMKEVAALFNLFYYSVDYDTFYKNVIFARANMNEGVFMYALTVAVIHRPDLFTGIVLPPIYEIYPYYFINSDVLTKAMHYKMGMGVEDFGKSTKMFHSNFTYNYNTVSTNDYYNYFGMDFEDKLTYFTEDIGLNAYYYYFNMDYPTFMDGEKFGLVKDRRGENYLYMYQQLLARYYLERMSNDMGPIETITFDKFIKTGYTPMLTYFNGMKFPTRMDNYDIKTSEYYTEMIQFVKDYEMRIRQLIDTGYFTVDGKRYDLLKYNTKGVDMLGNIIQGNVDSLDYKFFGDLERFARFLLGGSYKLNYNTKFGKLVPSVLEHYETTMRDPVFYQFFQKIVNFFFEYKKMLPTYTHEDLYLSGVKITDVKFDKLITYFDYFNVDISNALTMTKTEMNYDYKTTTDFVTPFMTKTQRLNHVPFTFNMDVVSDKVMPVVVRVYMGPKFDVLSQLNDYRKYFVEVDQFKYNLVTGVNTITRNSRDFYYSVRDFTTYSQLYKRVMTALKGTDNFVLDMSEAHCGFPDRLLLPKGKVGGMPFQFYFMITPYDVSTIKVEQFSTFDHRVSCGIGSGSRYIDNLPFYYPFDREIDYTTFFTPNMFFKDVMIYHKSEMEINKY